MQFRVLGSLEVAADRDVAELGPPKQRAVLALLALHAGEIVSIDRLIDLLWNDHAPRTAPHSLQIYVSALRKAIAPSGGPDVIETRHPGYRLLVPAGSVDALAFERLVESGRHAIESGDRERGSLLLRSALSMWKGPPLSDFTYDQFAQPYIRRLEDLRLDAIELVARVELESGLTTDALARLDLVTREDLLREQALELLMVALYRTGRAAEALRRYEAVRASVAAELGLPPSLALEELRARILRRDPTLSAPTGL